jgi:hypothetical protein
MKVRQLVKPIVLTSSMCVCLALGLMGCAVATPPARPITPTAVTSTTTKIPQQEPTPMPLPTLPTLPSTRQPRALETPITVAITETRMPAKDMQSIAVVFQWRGGFAPRNDLWTVFQNGLVRSNKGIEQNIGPQAVQKLLADLEALGYFALDEKYDSPACADCFEYSILVYRGSDQPKAVFAVDDGKLPESLTKIVAVIREAVAPTI